MPQRSGKEQATRRSPQGIASRHRASSGPKGGSRFSVRANTRIRANSRTFGAELLEHLEVPIVVKGDPSARATHDVAWSLTAKAAPTAVAVDPSVRRWPTACPASARAIVPRVQAPRGGGARNRRMETRRGAA